MGKLLSVVTGAATVLAIVVGYDAASYAATGDSLILGSANKAKKTTKLTMKGRGPALSVKTKAGYPPFAVSSSTKVENLNADTVDGVDSSALMNATTRRYVYSSQVAQPASSYLVDRLAPGSYVVSFNTNLTPSLGTPGSPSNVQCVLEAGGTTYGGAMDVYIGGFSALLSATDVITTAAPVDLFVHCAVGVASTYTFYAPLVVTVTRTGDGGVGAITRQP
jgi:hypothetical protein